MIKKSVFGLSLAVGLGLAAIAASGCSRGAGDVLATVNGEDIPMADYYKVLEMKSSVVGIVDPSRLNVDPATGQIARQATEVPIDSGYRLSVQALRDCINQVLTEQLAKDEGVYPKKEEIDEEIKFQTQRKPTYVADLSASGLSVDQIKRSLALQMATLRLWSKGVTVTAEEVDQAIKNNPQQFTEPEQAVLSMIEVADTKTRDMAEKELKESQLFTSVAQHYSVQPNGKAQNYRFPETVVSRFPKLLQDLVRKTPEFTQTEWQQDPPTKHWVKFYVERKVKAKPINIDAYVKEMVKRDLLLKKGSQSNDLNKRLQDKMKSSKIDVKVKYLQDPWKKLADSLMGAGKATPTETPAAK